MATADEGRQRRRDARIAVDWTVLCEKTVEIEQTLQEPLARVYQRVTADPDGVGERFNATLRDLSVNGAFLEGRPLPLLSRVAMVIDVPEWKRVEAVGWVLWRRSDSCSVTRGEGEPVALQAGFGVIFEWIALETRLEIAKRVAAVHAP